MFLFLAQYIGLIILVSREVKIMKIHGGAQFPHLLQAFWQQWPIPLQQKELVGWIWLQGCMLEELVSSELKSPASLHYNFPPTLAEG